MVRHSVSLILAAGPPAALAVKVATTTIPIVFVVGLDPVGAGLVASFNRPGGNATGVVLVSGPLGQKRLELVRDLVPKASVVAMLANPLSPDAVPEIREVQAVAQANGLQLRMLNASTPEEIEAAPSHRSPGNTPTRYLSGAIHSIWRVARTSSDLPRVPGCRRSTPSASSLRRAD
jgi:putative ABC transport system substrate-binding protein